MAAIKWVGGTSTDWNIDSNWSAAAKPTSADDVTFDSSGDVACTISAAAVCKSLTFATTYSKNFSTGGQTLTISGNFTWSGSGTLTINSTITQDADGNFIINNYGTSICTSGTLIAQGTGTITLAKINTRFYSITMAASGKITTTASFAANCGLYYSGGQVTIGAGTWTNNATFVIGTYNTQADPLVMNASATLNGTGTLQFIYQGTGTMAGIFIPAIISTGTNSLTLDCSTSATSGQSTYNFTGNLSLTGLTVLSRYGHDFIVNFNTGITITVTSFVCGTNTTTSDFTMNMNNAVVTTNSFSVTYNLAATIFAINMMTSTWTCKGNWTWGSNVTVDSATNSWSLTFSTNSGNITATVASGTPFYTLVINGSTKTYTQLDSLSCNTFTLTNGIYTTGIYNLTSVGTITLTAGTCTFGASVIISGDADLVIAAGMTTVTVTDASLSMQTGNLTISHVIVTGFTNITVAANKTVTYNGATACNPLLTGILTLGADAIWTNSTELSITCNSATPLVLGAGATINGTQYINFNSGSAATVTLPALNYTNGIAIAKITASAVSFVLGGDWTINTTAGNFYVYNNQATNTMTFDTGGYDISCKILYWGNATAGTSTINMNDTILTGISYIGSTYNLGTFNFNWMTSQWTLSGTLTMGSATVVNVGTTASVTFTGDMTLTTNGIAMPTLKNSNNNELKLGDNCTCISVQTTLTGWFTQNGKTLTITGASGVAGSITISGTGTRVFNTTVTMNGVGGTFTITGANTTTTSMVLTMNQNTTVAVGIRTISRMILASGKTYTMEAGATLTVTNYTAGDWASAIFVSSTPGTYWNLVAPNTGANITGVNVTDSNNSGTVITVIGGLNGGHNIGWLFPGGVSIHILQPIYSI